MKFTKRKAENIRNEIEMVMLNANKRIQAIKGIDKYQQLYGEQKVEISINQNSIVDRFTNKNWNKLDETIPEWSYQFIYDIAVSESQKNIYIIVIQKA